MTTAAFFEHFVITRWNVRAGFSDRGCDPGWIDHRLGLFERFCVPSVRVQTCRAFQWLLLVDEGTPADRVRAIERASDGIAEVVLCSAWKAAARARVARSQADWVITTRLDNDDAIHEGFVAIVQAVCTAPSFARFVAFPNGYTYDSFERRLRPRRFPNNPFVSLCERRETVATVYCASHGALRALGPFVDLETPAAWMQVVHGQNVVNRESRGTPIPDPASVLRAFGLEPPS